MILLLLAATHPPRSASFQAGGVAGWQPGHPANRGALLVALGSVTAFDRPPVPLTPAVVDVLRRAAAEMGQTAEEVLAEGDAAKVGCTAFFQQQVEIARRVGQLSSARARRQRYARRAAGLLSTPAQLVASDPSPLGGGF